MCNLRRHKMAIELMNFSYFSLCLVSFVLFGGIYYITPHYYSLSEKLVAALIVTLCGAETMDLVTVFDAILTSRQTREKLQRLYENLMSNNFRRTAVLIKI